MFTDIGHQIRASSETAWGRGGVVCLVGESGELMAAQRKATRFAGVTSPILITGESGVGKELFAKALYLLSERCGRPFLSVNCAQYQNDELLVSELFGHRKGSFTGAVADRKGLFEAAHGGVLFLDEVGELSMSAQSMLLRALSEGEVRSLGCTEPKRVDVRVIAATNRPLHEMVRSRQFREDLYYRLRYLHLHIPPIRARGDDWRLLVSYFLQRANRRYRVPKTMSASAWALLGAYAWPGNVREIRSVVDVGYCLSDARLIDAQPLAEALIQHEGAAVAGDENEFRGSRAVDAALQRMIEDDASFWMVVREPYLDRELNRREVREIVRRGLLEAGWSYKLLLGLFNLNPDEYLRFMDFLRHHRLKPSSPRRVATIENDAMAA